MNILIVNGSPKGENSITLKTAQFLEKTHPEHSFDYLNAAAQVRSLEKDFAPAAQKLETAELILFAYPVYTFLAPAQLHRFFELIQASGLQVGGRHGCQITTSKHFYDVTAHAFVRENMADLGLTTYAGLSADMGDLLTPVGQRQASDFFKRLMFEIENNMGTAPKPSVLRTFPQYSPCLSPADKRGNHHVALVYVSGNDDDNLHAMMDDFERALPFEVVRADVGAFPFKGGCIGCLSCAQDGHCIYADGFEEFLRNRIQSCDAIVYAFPIRSHFTGSRMKMFDDRQFCNGHRTVTSGRPVGYILQGALENESNLRTLLEARASVGGNYLAGFATDEEDPQRALMQLAARLTFALENNLSQPQDFFGVGGSKIFRDLVYGMQGFMQADHRFFKENDLYDFPQSDKKTLWGMRAVGAMLKIPSMRREVQAKLSEYMLRPYKEVLRRLP